MKKKNIYFSKVKVVEFCKKLIDHNLRDYDSHLVFCELNQFDVKIKVIPNGIEKYIAFFWIKTLCLLRVCNL